MGLEHVVAGYATEGQGAGPMFVTQRAGLFEQEGLDVEIRHLHGAHGVVRGLLDGEAQFGNLAAPALMASVLDGSDLVYITGGINQQFLVARPGLSALEDMAGKRIGASKPGEMADLFGQFLAARLAERGIAGVHSVYGHEGRNRIDGLFDGSIDAVIISPPLAVEARRRGATFLLDFAEFGLNFALGGVATTRRLVDADPDLVLRFVRAYVKGMHRYKTDKSFTMGVQSEYSGLTDPSIAEETYELTESGFPRVPHPVTHAIAVVLDVMAQTDPRARTDPNRFVESRFTRAVEASGLIEQVYGTTV